MIPPKLVNKINRNKMLLTIKKMVIIIKLDGIVIMIKKIIQMHRMKNQVIINKQQQKWHNEIQINCLIKYKR